MFVSKIIIIIIMIYLTKEGKIWQTNSSMFMREYSGTIIQREKKKSKKMGQHVSEGSQKCKMLYCYP